ncbi:MAG: hypothetical protein HY680_02475 [Chloroflexi bacterium]|nr:hypothetical protein [Chloroflexota bacterium]
MANYVNHTEEGGAKERGPNYLLDATAIVDLDAVAEAEPTRIPGALPAGALRDETDSSLTLSAFRPRDAMDEASPIRRPAWLEAQQRARALAVMDQIALSYMASLAHGKIEHVNEFATKVEEPRGWLKLASLVQAGYVELVDSSVRITPEGQAALEALRDFAERHARGGSSPS